MKGRLITNGVFSLISTICLIITIVGLSSITSNVYNNGYNYSDNKGAVISSGLAYALLIISWIVSVVMGIVTLAMQKDESVRGLTIASGILALFNGMFIANAIVSFIAVAKMNK